MSAIITSVDGKLNLTTKDFLLTSQDEVLKLPKDGIKGTLDTDDETLNKPCAYGSTAMVCTESLTEVYILTPNNEWVKM